MLGGITRMTLHKWTKRGMLHPVRFTSRNLRFDRAEIEHLANNGAQ
jgi:predicted site-specific integrase-resolvase